MHWGVAIASLKLLLLSTAFIKYVAFVLQLSGDRTGLV